MRGRPLLFRKVAIVGVGLIGGSVGMAIKKEQLAREVVGYSRRHSSLQEALSKGAIDMAAHDLHQALDGSDFVVLATPVKSVIGLFSMMSRHLKRGALVMDVGSTKANIVSAAQRELPNHVSFVGAHPLAGSEKKGVAFASAELFQNSVCIMTPTSQTSPVAQERVKVFWTSIGASVKVLSPLEHDRYLAHISHLPHLLSYALMSATPDESFSLLTPSFREITRIASSDPELWADICMTNNRNILQALDSFTKVLSTYRKAIISKDHNLLLEGFKKAKTKKDAIS